MFKYFYENAERYHTERKVWSRIKSFWNIQNNSQVISSIDKQKQKAAKIMSTFDFSMDHTKMKQAGTRDYFAFNSSAAIWPGSKSKAASSYSVQEIKACLEFLIRSSYFQVVSKIFDQVIGTPIGCDPALSFASHFFSLMCLNG